MPTVDELLDLLLEFVRASNEAASLRLVEAEREIRRLTDLLKSHAEFVVAEPARDFDCR